MTASHEMPNWVKAIVILFLLMTAACSSAYYGAMEKLGIHKREILVDRVEKVRDSQTEVKEQFASALERFKSVVAVDGGELEKRYNILAAELESSEKKANAVREKIDAVEDVSQALFREWEQELDQYDNTELRRRSREKLQATRTRYEQLINMMRKAEKQMDPVLAVFRDQVLFLKHNLNARAIASLRAEVADMEAEVESLVQSMEASIAEADRFIRSMASE